MEKDWNKVYKTSNFYTAEMIRQMLIDHHIPAVILNKKDSSYQFGFIEVFTHVAHENEARSLIAEFENSSPTQETE